MMRWQTFSQATHPWRAALAALALACGGDGLVWTDPMTVGDVSSDARLVVDDHGRASLVADTSIGVVPMMGDRVCAQSVRASRQHDATLVATWWTVREDSSAVLLAAISGDGGKTWQPAVRIDTVDVSTAGCRRPPPSIASSAGFVHVAYSMRGPEGTGVFYAHSMTLGRTFEPPQAILYGDRLTEVAVSADQGIVGVAYEDPSGRNPQIGLAISRDWGHIFSDRVRGSTGIGTAAMPRVAVTGRRIAVSWLQRSRGDESASRATCIVRVGRLS